MSKKAPTWEDYNRLQAENVGLRRGMRELQEELEKKVARLRHLLQSETIRCYDELDRRTGEYNRDIHELDDLIHKMWLVLESGMIEKQTPKAPTSREETFHFARMYPQGEGDEDREEFAERLGHELLASGFIKFWREASSMKTGEGKPCEILTASVRAIRPEREEVKP